MRSDDCTTARDHYTVANRAHNIGKSAAFKRYFAIVHVRPVRAADRRPMSFWRALARAGAVSLAGSLSWIRCCAMTSLILVSEAEDGVVRLTLNRPEKRNALSVAMRNEMSEALERLSGDQDVRVLVITGAGSAFCAGFDLSELRAPVADNASDGLSRADQFHQAILRFPVPVVAAINGAALAGGFDVAVLADLRIASDTARFAHPEQAWGDVIYRPLHDLVGGSIARELVLTGRSISAHEALGCGLVSRVVPAEGLAGAAGELAATIARAPREVLKRMKAKIIAATGISEQSTTLEL
jgi:enoyl-CoA hydratase